MLRRIFCFAGAAMLIFASFSACTSSSSAPGSASPVPETSATSMSSVASSGDAAVADSSTSGTRVFTLEELATYNGKDGQPAYVAVDGVVYDVTDVPQWANGEHYSGLTAGQDLTEEITNQSPHGLSVLDGLPVVGTLVS